MTRSAIVLQVEIVCFIIIVTFLGSKIAGDDGIILRTHVRILSGVGGVFESLEVGIN